MGPASSIVEKQILTELSEGRYLVVDNPPTLISALGAVPKSNSDDLRVIHDCSQPPGRAVNDYAPLGDKLPISLSMMPLNCLYLVDIAPKSIWNLHTDPCLFTQMIKVLWVWLGPSKGIHTLHIWLIPDYHLGAALHQEFSIALLNPCVVWWPGGVLMLLHILMISLFMNLLLKKYMSAVHVLIQLLRELGFSISYDKVEGPATRVTFLGIVVDSVSFTLELPQQKLNEFYAILLQFASRKRASLRQLQQLAGRLNWACQVVRGGRCYLRRILDMIKPLKLAHHKVVLFESFYADIDWWLQFLPVFNGKRLVLNHAPLHDVFVDASGTGSGFVFDTDWGYCGWRDIEDSVNHFHINEKEILSAVLAARRWAPRWANSRVLFHTDNITVRAALRTGSAKSPRIMPYLSELFWLSALFNFTMDAVHIPGHQNDTPDTISRLE